MSLQRHCLERGCEFQVDPLGLSNSALREVGFNQKENRNSTSKRAVTGQRHLFPIFRSHPVAQAWGNWGRQRESSGERKLQAERTTEVLTRRMRGKLGAKGCGSVTGLVRSESHNRGQSSSFLQEYDKDKVLSEWIGQEELLLSILSRGLSW